MNHLNLSEQVFESKCECCDEQQDFVVGDVVVSLCDGITSELFEVRELAHAIYPEFIKCRPLKTQPTSAGWLSMRFAAQLLLNSKPENALKLQLLFISRRPYELCN